MFSLGLVTAWRSGLALPCLSRSLPSGGTQPWPPLSSSRVLCGLKYMKLWVFLRVQVKLLPGLSPLSQDWDIYLPGKDLLIRQSFFLLWLFCFFSPSFRSEGNPVAWVDPDKTDFHPWILCPRLWVTLSPLAIAAAVLVVGRQLKATSQGGG